MADTREALLVRTFVGLADSMVAGHDIVGVLQNLVDDMPALFDTAAAGITLGPDDRNLEVVASTGGESHLVGLMQVRAGEGPCVEAVTTGIVVSVRDLTEMRLRYPVFADAVARSGSGFVAVHAIPLRSRRQTIGSLNLFRDHEGVLSDPDAIAARALADVATIAVLQERTVHDGVVLRRQLQRALASRVVIEQAKGVLAEIHQLDMDAAFQLLLDEARSTHTPLRTIAARVIDGTHHIAP